MNILKKLIALALVAMFVLSLAGCHPKDEIAVTSGDYKITSAMYSYYLVMADSEAQKMISDDETIDTTAKGFDLYKQKIGDKTYEQYVKDLAMEKCLAHIAYQKLCDENKIVLDDEAKSNAVNQAQYNWQYQGYGQIFSPNGVSYETYEKIISNLALGDAYFKHLYGKDGSKSISAEDIQKTMDENYAAVYILVKDYSSETEPDVDALTADLEQYKTRLEAGEDFEKIYNDFNGITSEEESAEETTEDTSTEEESDEPKPQDENISILGSEETSYAFGKFEDVKKMEIGAVSIIHDTDAKCLYVVAKKDINADSYYRDEYLDTDIRYVIKGDEFDKDIKAYAAKLEHTVNSFAINQFKVKKISYGE